MAGRIVQVVSARRLSPTRRSWGSCARPPSSQRLGVLPCTPGLGRLSPVPAGRWPFPTLSLQSLRRRLDPYPAVSPRGIRPLPPWEHRPHATVDAFGTRKYPCHATSTGSRISGLQSFVYLQAPTLARPPGRTHRSHRLGGQAVYTTHHPDGYPFRAVASLRVRHGQLTRLDSHQLDCSLVGCSLPHTAPISGAWRRNEHLETGAGSWAWVSSGRLSC